jgi:HEAT repeat protein
VLHLACIGVRRLRHVDYRLFGLCLLLVGMLHPGPRGYALEAGADPLPKLHQLKKKPDPARFAEVLALARIEDDEVQTAAHEALLAIPGWKKLTLQAAKDKDPALRSLSVLALALDKQDSTNRDFPKQYALLLLDSSLRVRKSAASSVLIWEGSAHEPLIRPALLQASQAEKDDVLRYTLWMALARLADASCEPALEKGMVDKDSEIRMASIHGLGNLAVDSKNPAFQPSLHKLMEMGKARDRDPVERGIAFYYIGRSGGEEGIKFLEQLKKSDESEQVRKAAGEALANVGSIKS